MRASMKFAWKAISLAGILFVLGVLGETDQEMYLREHNAWRREVGAPDLTWNSDIADIAQAWADNLASTTCSLAHRSDLSSIYPSGSLGENIYYAGGWPAGEASVPGRDALSPVLSWVSEKAVYNLGPVGDACTQDDPAEAVGHYTAVVWSRTQEVGCGSAVCTAGDISSFTKGIWVCNYFPAGNMGGQQPFCSANLPANVDKCASVAEPGVDSDAPNCGTPSASCQTAADPACCSCTPCSLDATWEEIDDMEFNQGETVFTGGLGHLLEAGVHEVWLCKEMPCAPNDLACFKFSETTKQFVWWGFNSELRLVPPEDIPV
mmetsp:Transcript_55236/g.113000  ORF Transcript_55236/g.113000 Transcript_55236/m.113000 type:complete len:320 (+) Transcript_55236:63-1022(+)